MAMSARLTLRGMVSYKPDLFYYLELPTAPIASEIGVEAEQLRSAWTINKDDFVEFLCLQTESMSLAIPDYDYLKNAIGVWSRAHIHEWQRMFDTLFLKYNPIWNKDYSTTESETINKDLAINEQSSLSSSGNNDRTDYTHAYDGGASTEPDPMSTATPKPNIAWTHSDKSLDSASSSASGSKANMTSDDTVRSRATTEHGNIGVTSTQEMIEAERRIALYSIEEYLAEEFKKTFCIMLW